MDENPIPNLGFLVQCSLCSNIFTRHDFPAHICEAVDPEVQSKELEATRERQEGIYNRDCISLLEDNWSKLRRFIKEELKIQLDSIESSSGEFPLNSSNECHICFKKLSTKTSLVRHIAKHENDPKDAQNATNRVNSHKNLPTLDYGVCFVCLLCGRAFANVDQCEDHLWKSDSHLEISNKSTKINTEEAAENDGNEREAGRGEDEVMRMDAVVLKSVFQCEFCDYVFARKEDVLKHEATHDPKFGYICTGCEINFTAMKEMQQHGQSQCPFTTTVRQQKQKSWPTELERIRLGIDFVCNVCFETFNSLDVLYDHRHKENHYFPRYSPFDEILLVGCEVCGEMFDSCVKYCEHFDENHTKKSKTAALARNRQYLCDVCGKTYTQSSHLWQHLRFHQGVKPFLCSVEGCGRRFTIRPDLNDHVRKFHTHERPYQCLVCGKRFLTGSVFYQHRLIHRGERRYECETCHKKFFRADALKNHNRIHTGEKPFSCLVCTKTFRQRGDCQKHMEVRHMKP